MGLMSGWYLIPVVYLVLIAVLGGLAYLALRFAIRDGLRGHQLWLERTGRSSRTTGSSAGPSD